MSFEPEISVDAPIEGAAQDILGRKGFAEHISKALIRLVRGPAIVVGLNGPWGSGKSSIKNLILEDIAASTAQIEIVEFNPWQYESSSQLTNEFFSELAIAATSGIVDDNEKKERRAKLWKYGSRVAKVGAVGLSAFLPVIGVALEKGAKELIEQFGKVMDEAGSGLAESVHKESLTKLKKELSKELATLQRPILVVIDDIDRLDGDEVKLLFKLVKANADFPNVSYLLLFARERVEKALSEFAEDGTKYLEKIVAVSFDIPALTREETLRIFSQEVKPLLDNEQVKGRLQIRRWNHASENCIRPYLDTVRTVKRFTNMLRFLTSIFSEDEGLNVNIVDLAVLEVLRQFEPKVYKQVSHLSQALTEGSYFYFVRQHVDDDQRMALFKELPESAGDKSRESLVRACLQVLFPQIDWTTGDYTDDKGADQDLGNLRISRSAYFSRYFAFDVSVGAFSESELKAIFASTRESKTFKSVLDSLGGDKSVQLLLLMKARSQEIEPTNFESIFEALYIQAEEGVRSAELLEDVAPQPIDAELLLELLKLTSSDAERIGLIRDVAERINALILPLMLVSTENTYRSDPRSQADSFLGDNAFKDLKAWAIQRIEAEAQEGRLLHHGGLLDLLHFWSWLVSIEAPQKWISSLAGNPQNVAVFLEKVVAPKLKSDRDVLRSAHLMPKSYASDFRDFQSDLQILDQQDLKPSLRRAVNYALLLNRGLSKDEETLFYKNELADDEGD